MQSYSGEKTQFRALMENLQMNRRYVLNKDLYHRKSTPKKTPETSFKSADLSKANPLKI